MDVEFKTASGIKFLIVNRLIFKDTMATTVLVTRSLQFALLVNLLLLPLNQLPQDLPYHRATNLPRDFFQVHILR